MYAASIISSAIMNAATIECDLHPLSVTLNAYSSTINGPPTINDAAIECGLPPHDGNSSTMLGLYVNN
jgi:hypothetical protein